MKKPISRPSPPEDKNTGCHSLSPLPFAYPLGAPKAGSPASELPAFLCIAAAWLRRGAVFLATIIASVIGTLVMGLAANVPYAQAPGMGLNAFFVYTVCFGLGFTWQQALSMVFLCGLVNILITVTKLRKHIIKSIPASLQNAIGGGIGIFVAYIGMLNIGLIDFSSGVPALAVLDQPALVIVGVMMMSSFREIDWTELSEAIPAFFAGVFMALCYSISYGIAAGFFFYCLVKISKKQAKEIHPIIWVSTALFVLNFILTAAM